MRKSFFFAGLAAIAAISFSSCSKNEVETPDSPKTFTHTVTIKAGAPETRTEIVMGETSATYKWSSDDNKRFIVKENDVRGTNVGISLSEDNTIATFQATFSSTASSEYVYTAFLAGTLTGGDPKPRIPYEQTPTANSYDPDADILIAKPITASTAQEELKMQFYRPVVINKMTLKGLTSGATVSTVEITGLDNKYLTGYYILNSDSWATQRSTITVTLNQRVPESGELDVFFVTMPVDGVKLSVRVNSDKGIYFKEFAKTIDLKEGQVTVFSVNNLGNLGSNTTFTVGSNTTENTFEIASIFPSVKNGIKFAYNQGESTTAPAFYSPFRWYKNSTVTISAGTTPIKMIVFKNNGSFYAEPDKGHINMSTRTWTPDEATTSVTFTNTGIQIELTSIDVYTEAPGTETVVTSTPTLTIDEDLSLLKGASKKLITNTNYNNGTITYASNNENIATVDSDGNVTGVSTGSATITATIPAVSTEYYIINSVSANCAVEVTSPEDATTYTLVTDVADLTVDSKIILVSSESNYALSATQNTNNRVGVEITKSSDGNSIAVIPEYNVQELTIGNGYNKGTYSLSTGGGFLCAASSSSNNLKTTGTLDANGSWTISISSDGDATIIATGSYSRNCIRYNPNNGSPIFTCYATGSTTGENIRIYKDASTGGDPITPKTPSMLSISDATTVYTIGDTYEFDGTVTLVYSDNSTESLTGADYTVDVSDVDMTAAGSYSVIVKYNADNSVVGSIAITVTGGSVPNPYSMTPDNNTTGSTSTTYVTSLTDFTCDGIAWKMNQWNPSSLQIRTNQSSAASEFRFYNASAFPGRITKVVIKFSALTVADAGKLMFLGGTSEVTETTGGTAGTWNSTDKTLTWTPSDTEDYTYFAFYQNGKAASGTNYLASEDAIVVYYESN